MSDVTVVIPAKDREGLLARALASVERQTTPPTAVIVVDDGSTDRTADVARAAGAIVVELTESGGSGMARNRGIELATTGWIAFLDSDDEWEPSHLENLVGRAGDYALVTAPALSSSGEVRGNPWPTVRSLEPLQVLTMRELIVTSGTMVRRDVLRDAGSFRSLPRGQDLDLWLRVLERGKGVAVPEITVRYCLHEAQASTDQVLVRKCLEQIVADYAQRPWLGAARLDRCHVKYEWDDLRMAQRRHDPVAVARHLSWFVRRPRVLGTLAQLLRLRRQSRSAAGQAA